MSSFLLGSAIVLIQKAISFPAYMRIRYSKWPSNPKFDTYYTWIVYHTNLGRWGRYGAMPRAISSSLNPSMFIEGTGNSTTLFSVRSSDTQEYGEKGGSWKIEKPYELIQVGNIKKVTKWLIRNMTNCFWHVSFDLDQPWPRSIWVITRIHRIDGDSNPDISQQHRVTCLSGRYKPQVIENWCPRIIQTYRPTESEFSMQRKMLSGSFFA